MKLSITAMMSGAMCPEQLLIDCKKLMNCNVFVGYGSTECSPLITQAMGCPYSIKKNCITVPGYHPIKALQTDSVEQRTRTVGALMPHTEGKVMDRGGKMVARGQTGELLVRGTNIFIGYWDDKEKTRNVIFTVVLQH